METEGLMVLDGYAEGGTQPDPAPGEWGVFGAECGWAPQHSSWLSL